MWDYDTWEPATNFKNAPEKIEKYKKENFQAQNMEFNPFSMELESEEGVLSQFSHDH